MRQLENPLAKKIYDHISESQSVVMEAEVSFVLTPAIVVDCTDGAFLNGGSAQS